MENYSTLALEVSHAKVSRTNIAIITSENSNPINGIHIVWLPFEWVATPKIDFPFDEGAFLKVPFQLFPGVKTESTFALKRPIIELPFVNGDLIAILHEGHPSRSGSPPGELAAKTITILCFDFALPVGLGVFRTTALINASVGKRNNELLSHSKKSISKRESGSQ